ncbi:LysR family transcriptional regulator [Vibrio sp. S9_S30]|uniref:LysR family transcriptional regulator n=1 Tax=Vibrio sp. S9_S30 TaxID=2720226 RepID=UPI00168029E9|nr:LysR family transcriptional regulator [Vibrio sp. S9_S30]MBD1558078.1 LysR family transcriptional regulator [Vibrio sp. S9_S30]
MNNNISLLDVKAFVAIVSYGSFTNAAEALGASKAHLSRQLSQLERALGVQLLIRTTRSLKLTEQGERFYSKSQAALMEIEQAAFDALEQSASMSGLIRINSLGGAFGEEYLSQAIAEFSMCYPEIRIDISFDSKQVSLMEDEFDLVIRSGNLPDSRMVARHLMDMDVGVFCSQDYLKGKSLPSHPSQFKEHRCLTGTIDKWTFTHSNGESQTIQVSPSASCSNSRVLLTYAINGMGICRLPSRYAETHLRNGKLVHAIEDWSVASIPIHLIYNKNRYQPEKLKTLIQFLCAWFQNGKYSSE